MNLRYLACSAIGALMSGYAFAADDFVIEQVGNKPIASPAPSLPAVNNSPDLANVPPAEKPEQTFKTQPDYQNSILNNGYMTAPGRAQNAINMENSEITEKLSDTQSADQATVKKTPAKSTPTLLQQEKKYNQSLNQSAPKVGPSTKENEDE